MTDDVEIQAWWKEVIEKGHPDTNSADWPIINSVAALQDVAASIMWTSSCHHAGRLHMELSTAIVFLGLTTECTSTNGMLHGWSP